MPLRRILNTDSKKVSFLPWIIDRQPIHTSRTPVWPLTPSERFTPPIGKAVFSGPISFPQTSHTCLIIKPRFQSKVYNISEPSGKYLGTNLGTRYSQNSSEGGGFLVRFRDGNGKKDA
jgi:hypothetical protein